MASRSMAIEIARRSAGLAKRSSCIGIPRYSYLAFHPST
jgi:hypothetical protein